MAKKRQLVYGALWDDPIPGYYLTDPIYRNRIIKLLEGRPGIYALYNGNKQYYVGKTGDLYWRGETHLERDQHSGKWDKFKIFIVRDEKYLADLEALILNIYKPPGNTKTPRFFNDAYVLQEEINKLIKEIRKAAKNSY